jgi:PAS domain-containing protein
MEFSNNFVDKIIELNPFAIAIFDAEGHYVRVNQAFLKLFETVPPEDYSFVKNLVLIAKGSLEEVAKIKNGEIISYSERDYNPDGHYEGFPDIDLTLRIVNFPIMDENNQVEYIVSMTQNITDLKQTQEELELALQRSSIISMISAIFIHDVSKLDENIIESLHTLGRALNANYCSILQHVAIESEIEFKVKYLWTLPQNSGDFQNIEEILKKIYLTYYSHKLPPEIYYAINIATVSKKYACEMEKNQLNLVLMIPVIVGSDRYGTLVINRKKIWKDFSENEIKTALSAAILIGLALENQSKQKTTRDILESLNKLDIGIAVIQNNAQNNPILKYHNAKFKEIYGFEDEKLHTSEGFTDFISLEDISFVEKLYLARQRGHTIPNHYRINIKTATGIKQVHLGVTIGLYEKKAASYCFLIEIPQEELKTPKEIFDALLS